MAEDHGGGHGEGHGAVSNSKASPDRRVVVFVAIIAAAMALALGSVFVLRLHPLLAFIFLLAVAVVAVFFPKLEVFTEYERGVVFRLGKFWRVLGPGLFVVFPIIDRVVRVDLRDQIVDIPSQPVITQDNIKLDLDAIVYTKVVDPKKAVTEVKDYTAAIRGVMYAEIRNIVAKMDLEVVLEKTEEINSLLTRRAQVVAEKWGVTASRVEVEHIVLPPDLTRAMTRRREAEEWKARIITEAEARTAYISALNDVATKLSPTTLDYLRLESLKRIGESGSTKIVLPMELSSLAGAVASKFGFKREEEKKQ